MPLLDLQAHAKSYDFDEAKFTRINNYIIEQILDYHPDFGRYLAHHLVRFSKNTADFMTHLGTYDDDTIRKISMGGKVHDCGKIMQDVAIHLHKPTKPTQEEKDEKRLHVYLAIDVIEDAVRKTGTRLNNDDLMHIETMLQIARNHHERLDGSGPCGMTGHEMDDILRIITIIDEVDGKIKLENNKDLRTIFGEICGKKHEGMFDLRLSNEYDFFCEQRGLYRDIPGILNAPYPRTT